MTVPLVSKKADNDPTRKKHRQQIVLIHVAYFFLIDVMQYLTRPKICPHRQLSCLYIRPRRLHPPQIKYTFKEQSHCNQANQYQHPLKQQHSTSQSDPMYPMMHLVPFWMGHGENLLQYCRHDFLSHLR